MPRNRCEKPMTIFSNLLTMNAFDKDFGAY